MTEKKAEASEKTSDKTKEKTRPMGVTEKRELGKLIDNDFAVLRGDMQVFANELKRQRIAQIEEEFREREEEMRGALGEWREVRRQCFALVDAYRNRWQEQGFRVSGIDQRGYGQREMIVMPDTISVTVPEKDVALTGVENDVDHQWHKARNELERQRLALQRELLLTGLVSEQARGILDKLPDPREMLMTAIQNSGNPRLLAIEAAAVQQVRGEAVAAPAADREEEEVEDAVVVPEAQRIHIPEVLDQ